MMKIELVVGGASLLLVGCAGMQMPSALHMGDSSAKTVATGSAGGNNAQGANEKLERCERSLGTLALVEDTNQPWFIQFRERYNTHSTVPMLRMIIQQSNCFVVVERGRASINMQQERDLQARGELRSKSNMGKGQIVAADYTVTPSISFSQKGTGGLGAVASTWMGPIAGTVVGGMQSSEASTMLLMTDNRSGVQLAAAEGSAKNWDFAGGMGVFSHIAGGAAGFSNTPEGKVLAASFMDSYNQLVKAVRNYKAQTVEGGLGTGGSLRVAK